MGTRNLTMVQYEGELKVAQYGQWDGNPNGQGETCAKFIRIILSSKDNLKLFKEKVKSLKYLTKEKIAQLDNEGKTTENILNYIEMLGQIYYI